MVLVLAIWLVLSAGVSSADPIMSFYHPGKLGNGVSSDDAVSLFSSSPEELVERCEQIKKITLSRMKVIEDIAPEKRTYTNTIRALEESDNELDSFDSIVFTLSYLSPLEHVRNEASRLHVHISDFSRSLFMKRQIYEILQEYENNLFKIEKEILSPEEMRFFKKTLKNLKQYGYALPDKQFEELKEINAKLSRVSYEYGKAINHDASYILVDEDELDGVDKNFIDNLERNDDGFCIIRCDYPSLDAVMGYCHSSDVRKRLSQTYFNRCFPENISRLEEVLALRDKAARLLGFNSAADSSLENSMVGSVEAVEAFIQSLAQQCAKKSDVEFASLISDLPKGIRLLENGKLQPYDAGYVENYYKEKHFNVDERKIAEYFPVEYALSGMLRVYEQFLGLSFVQVSCNAWHEDVRLIEVYSSRSGKKLGYIFLDLFPRPNKYSHACFIGLIPSIIHADGSGSLFVGAIVANFPKGTVERPGLLRFDDVQTFFHEFGHCMHGLMGRTSMAATSGTSVVRDFVETPSQMFERWVEQPEILAIISSHYQTGEPLPRKMVKDMLAVKNFNYANAILAQLKYALISLRLHGPGEKKDSTQIVHDILRSSARHYEFNPLTHMHAAFGHLMGYGAGYYGYMWSKVFADDLFAEVKRRGLLDPKVGKNLVNNVLGRGDTADPYDLLEGFLGRKPSIDSFLKINGLHE